MENKTENSTENFLEIISENNSVSETESFTRQREHFPENQANESSALATGNGISKFGKTVSQHLFRWRSGIAVGAILVIAVLHITYQLSFQNVITENIPNAVVPAGKSAREDSVGQKPIEIEARNIEKPSLQKKFATVKPHQLEITPVKRAPNRKKIPVESRAERLRRAERILTGV